MKMDLGSKAAKMTIVGAIFFVIMVIASFAIMKAISDEPISWFGLIVFSLLIAGLGSGWIFRNIHE